MDVGIVAYIERNLQLTESLQSAIRALRGLDADEELVSELERALLGE